MTVLYYIFRAIFSSLYLDNWTTGLQYALKCIITITVWPFVWDQVWYVASRDCSLQRPRNGLLSNKALALLTKTMMTNITLSVGLFMNKFCSIKMFDTVATMSLHNFQVCQTVFTLCCFGCFNSFSFYSLTLTVKKTS